MKILFFGDFHFDSKPLSGGLSIEYPEPVADDPVMRLIEPLKDRYAQGKVSLMVFLGDYGKGKDTEENKLAAFRRIKDFVSEVEAECYNIFDNYKNSKDRIKDRIVFLDGNHDVSREGEHHKAFSEVFGDYLTPFTPPEGKGIRKYGAPVFDFKQFDMLFACISTTLNANAHLENTSRENADFKQLKALIEPLQEHAKENYSKILKLLTKPKNVDIGSVTSEAIRLLRKNSNKLNRIRIVASHHPLIQMQHATATHFETVNGPLFFDTARAKKYTYFVSGHLHEFYCVDITSRGKSSALPSATLISVPTFINTDTQAVRFVELEIKNDTYICRLLTYDSMRDMFVEDDVASNDPRNHLNVQGEHVLLDYEIQSLVEEGNIIKGASTERIQSISYDCALGLHYKRYDETHNTWPDDVIEMEAKPEGPAKIELAPGERVLLYTHEEFCIPSDMMLQASPRASWNRRGISVDLSFFVEPGFEGPFCFPVTNKNNHTIEISAQEPIMSVTFHKLSNPVNKGWRDRAPDSLKIRKNKQDK